MGATTSWATPRIAVSDFTVPARLLVLDGAARGLDDACSVRGTLTIGPAMPGLAASILWIW